MNVGPGPTRPEPDAAEAPGRGRSSRIGPEVIALVLSTVVAVSLGGGALAGVRLPDGGPEAPSPAASPSAATRPTATPGPSVNAAAITVCLQIDARLIVDREALIAELASDPFESSNAAAILRGANADLIQAADIAAHLGPTSEALALSRELTAYYSELHALISDGLVNSVQNVAAYQALASEVVGRLAKVEAFDVRLTALLRSDAPSPGGASGSPAPGGSPRPGGSPVVTPVPPTASPVPTASIGPGPSTGPPLAGGLVNPGFEAGVGPPWELVVTATAQASLHEDRAIHGGGGIAARVDIGAAGEERAAVAVRQGGLLIEAGSHYVATFAVRAETPREVRIRLASAAGDTYGTRLFTIGPTWQTLTLDATVLASDSNAYLEIDLGRFAVATWIDDVTFVRVAATGG